MASPSSMASSSSLSAQQLPSSHLQLHLRVHHRAPCRLPFHSSVPLGLGLRISRPHRPPLALSSSSNGDTNNNNHDHGGNNSSGGGGGDSEAEDDGSSSDGKRWEALFVLAQAGRNLESLPADLAAAIKGGRVTGAFVLRFLQMEMEGSALRRWLLQFGGFRERLLADDLFLAKLAMECGVGVVAKTAAEYEKRGKNFIKNIDAVIADVVMAIVADFMLVYLSARTLSLQPALGTISAIISETVSDARPFLFLDRLGKIVRISPKLIAIGISSSQVDTSVTSALIEAREAVAKFTISEE